jgi:hypothetical protein
MDAYNTSSEVIDSAGHLGPALQARGQGLEFSAGDQLEDLRVLDRERSVRLHNHPLPVFPDKDKGHPYRALSTALVEDA